MSKGAELDWVSYSGVVVVGELPVILNCAGQIKLYAGVKWETFCAPVSSKTSELAAVGCSNRQLW